MIIPQKNLDQQILAASVLFKNIFRILTCLTDSQFLFDLEVVGAKKLTHFSTVSHFYTS